MAKIPLLYCSRMLCATVWLFKLLDPRQLARVHGFRKGCFVARCLDFVEGELSIGWVAWGSLSATAEASDLDIFDDSCGAVFACVAVLIGGCGRDVCYVALA